MSTKDSLKPQYTETELQQALEFFQKYREFVFDGPAAMACLETAPLGPVEPWSPYNPHDTGSETWHQLLAAHRKLLFPEHPFQSGMLPGTFRMWDYILTSGVSKLRAGPLLAASTSARALQPCRGDCVNTFWTEDMRHDFAFDIKDSRYTVDFRCIPEGRRLLEAAHAMAHHRCNSRLVETASVLKLHGRLTDEFHKAAAELAIGYYTGVPVDVKSQGVDVAMAYGLQARPTAVLGFETEMPVLRVPVRANMGATVNKTLAYVCAAVQIGRDPAKFVDSTSGGNYPQDCWAYQPVKIFIAGWETAAWMAMQPLVYPDSTLWRARDTGCDFACHVKDLMPATTLGHYIAMGREYMPATDIGDRYVDVRTWLDSDDCQALVETAPPMPCVTCMYAYNDFAGGLCAPRGPRPYRKKKMPAVWVKYFQDFRRAMKLVTRAQKMMYNGVVKYRPAMAARRRNFKRIITEARRRINARKKW